MGYPTEPEYCCPHAVRNLASIQGGTREYPEGVRAFVTAEDGDVTVTIDSRDRAGLAAALRRAADEIEGASPFDLPPVLALPNT